MVKQAAKNKNRSPLSPIFGIIIGGGLLAVAIMVMLFITGGQTPFPQIASAVGGLTGRNYLIGRALVVLAIWFIMLGIAYFLVGIVTGRDPESPQNVPMPPRHIKKKK